jgi:hypothetical protein
MPLDSYGYDADPINDGRCCKICNQDVVLPIQMKLVLDPSPNHNEEIND